MAFSLLFAATLVSGMFIGLIPTLADGVRRSIRSRLGLPEGRVDWFVWLFYLVWLPAMPMAGWALDSWRWGVDPRPSKEILFYSLVVLILSLTSLAHVRSFVALLFCAACLGVAYSGVTTATVYLMTQAFFPAYVDDYPMLSFASLNLGFVAVGLGALVGPFIVRSIEKWWGYRQGLLFVSMACILPAALTILSDPTLFPKPADAAAAWKIVFLHPYMGMLAGIILFYFALENCLEFWPEAYLKELGYQERSQRTGMIFFWLSFIATRGAAAWWLYYHPGQGFALMVVLACLAALVVGNLAGGYEVGSGSFGFFLAGAVYGPLLPGFLGMAFVLFPELPLSALGALLALSGLDTLLVRPLMQRFGKNRPARAVMRVPAILALLLAAPLMLLAFMRPRP